MSRRKPSGKGRCPVDDFPVSRGSRSEEPEEPVLRREAWLHFQVFLLRSPSGRGWVAAANPFLCRTLQAKREPGRPASPATIRDCATDLLSGRIFWN
jgi:hypothetical protein